MKYMGLTEEEVIISRNKYGSNVIREKNKNTFIKLFIESLGDPMIKILLVVLGIKLFFLFADFDWFETLGIFIAIFVASLISTISEYGSNKAFIKLIEKNNLKYVKVKRNNVLKEILEEEIVVGDIIYLKNGDYIPADGIIVDGHLLIDESSINGETKDIYKAFNMPLDKSKVYCGTIVNSGEAFMKVLFVGENTLFGAIAKEIQDKSGDSPLRIRLRHLAKVISKIGYIGAFLVFFSYLFSVIVISNDFNWSLIIQTLKDTSLIIDYIIYGLTLAVTIIIVSVPEGLPMMVALVLSTNMKKMVKKNILVRKMVGIETAGSLNVLFSDKTGTLTYGRLNVIALINYKGKKFNNDIELNNYPDYYNLVGHAMILNNEVVVSLNKIISGNSTDKALYSFMSYNIKDEIKKRVSFDSDKKYSSITCNKYTYFKGAPEVIISKCNKYYDNGNVYDISIDKINNDVSRYMHSGFRVIALAYGENELLDNLIFIGLVLLKDEIRKDAKEGLDLIKGAGVNIIMITGDSLDTAMYIGKELDMIDNKSLCLTSSDLSLMSDDEIKSKLLDIKIIARAKPTDKSRLVKLVQEMNLVVGMTGDGINDAAALKKADVGFGMGSGTEVAKEAADIIILNDNINSIGTSILYGRTIFKNIRKFIIFQLSVNICAMLLSIIGPFIGINTPVTVMQMLWINMIMDTLAGLAFAYEEAFTSYMKEKPKDKMTPIINKYMYEQIFFSGVFSFLICVLFLKLPLFKEIVRYDLDNKYFFTAFFGLFVFLGIFNAFNTRTNKVNIFYRISNNKVFLLVFIFVGLIQLYFIYFGGSIFRTYGLNLKELLLILGLSFSIIPFDIIRKILIKHKKENYI